MSGQPIFILSEGSRRTKGSDAQNNNIMAAKAVAEAVRTTLGPKGMDKMLVDSMGDVIITNDGAAILREMDIEHPAAKMIVEISKTQDAEVGDGTTTAAVLAGELLANAEELLEDGIHPTIISAGYRLASEKAQEIVNSIALDASVDDVETLKKIAATAITGKGAEAHKDKLSELTVEAVRSITKTDAHGKVVADTDKIKVEKRAGGSIDDSVLIDGVIIDKERVHPNMPTRIEDAKILLLGAAIEYKKTETKSEIKITSPDQMLSFIEQEEAMLKEIINKVLASGANVVFCQKGIDDLAQYYLAKAGVLAARRIKQSDMTRLSEATNAKILTSIDEISAEELGEAKLVEEKETTGSKMIYVTGCPGVKSVSLFLRGGTEHVVDALDRAVEDAIRVVGVAIEDQKVVVGGGSPEIEVSLRLQEYAATLSGREQLAVAKFADALEIIPQTLAENAGLDPINMLAEMKAQHEKGNKNAGLNVYEGKVEDMYENSVLEPLRIKTQAINAATESTIMILRIDDVIASAKTMPMPQGMPGMGGMPPGMM
ncbi:60 kDa chaperonin 1 [Methanimicrococcus sp. At1]|uniref:60 kDa chaperonin 1 n=1 Tax=Methanimicrococcus hacksteinii TaxID=3028293 RepID=A0ABU3VP60_9EURY|nr:thermosome subunit alpha [Methanimicrococcus sp. At1]MDV0445204.1 60 kDa chaperonin 1 [Methanimicrococcus sp. At1]